MPIESQMPIPPWREMHSAFPRPRFLVVQPPLFSGPSAIPRHAASSLLRRRLEGRLRLVFRRSRPELPSLSSLPSPTARRIPSHSLSSPTAEPSSFPLPPVSHRRAVFPPTPPSVLDPASLPLPPVSHRSPGSLPARPSRRPLFRCLVCSGSPAPARLLRLVCSDNRALLRLRLRCSGKRAALELPGFCSCSAAPASAPLLSFWLPCSGQRPCN